MTNQEKQTATRLRNAGQTYRQIAASLNLSESCIKSYFRKRNTPSQADLLSPTSGFCEECGAPVTYTPGHKRKRFCSYSCRMKWWQKHPDAGHRKAFYTFTCASCGKTFTAYGNAHRKYCSISCAGKGAASHE